MKKTMLLIAVLLISLSGFSQTGFGVKAGFNFNSMQDIGISDLHFKNKTGWHAGVVYKVKLPLGFAIQPELIYSQKTSSYSNVNSQTKGDMKLGYLQLPIGVQWGVDLMLFRPYLQVVPYLGYAVSTKNTVENFEWDVNKLQYGIGFGAGLEIWKFQVSGRYCWDLGKVADFSWDNKTFGNKNKGFELSIALIF